MSNTAAPARLRELDRVPVQQDVRAQRVELANRRRPRQLHHRRACDRSGRRRPAGRSGARCGVARDRETRAALPRTAGANRPACRGRACCARTPCRNRRAALRRRVRPRVRTSRALRIWLRTLRSSRPTCRRPSGSRIDDLVLLARQVRELRGRRGAARRGRTAARCASLARGRDQRLGRVGRVGHHAAVVQKRQRGQRVAEQQALDLHERQHAGDLRRRVARDQIDRFVAERVREYAAPAPRVVAGVVAAGVDERCPTSSRSRSASAMRDAQRHFGMRPASPHAGGSAATGCAPPAIADRPYRTRNRSISRSRRSQRLVEAAVVPQRASAGRHRQPRLVRIDFPGMDVEHHRLAARPR